MWNWLQPRQLARAHPNPIFWGAFLVLNGLLFLPLFLLQQGAATLLPGADLFADGWWLAFNRLFLWRANLDPFRLAVEFTVLTAVWVSLRWFRRRSVAILFSILYLLTLAYHCYEAIMLSVYLAEPVFYSQFYLARDGLPFLLSHVKAAWWIYVAAFAALTAAVAGVSGLLYLLFKSGAASRLHLASRVAMVLLAGLAIAPVAIYQGYTARPEMVVSSIGHKLARNLTTSRQIYEDVITFDDQAVQAAYDFSTYPLQRKPDIYLIFVESYGSVLYKRPDYRGVYTNLLTKLEKELESAGWHTTSTLSESPTWGAGSWMAYCSVLLGIRIDNHPQFLSLFNKYQVADYPNLGRTLQEQGYYFAWVSALEEQLDERAWTKYRRFYGVDEVIRYRDLNYQGVHYGWGPSPPDQYVLNHTIQRLQQATDKPLFYFTITQNSHYPWAPLPALADDWRTLDSPQPEPAPVDPEAMAHEVMRRHYAEAISYQLETLTSLILEQGDDNSLFILIGDHQPTAVARQSDGWDTLVHVISRNPALVAAFEEYGFTPGLQPPIIQPTVRHEGMYSMLMRVLVDQYGFETAQLPAYLPNGAAKHKLLQSVAQQ